MKDRKLSFIFKTNTDLVICSTLIIVWIGTIVSVNPIGNFPLDDDWAYGWTVKQFLETGEYKLSDWTATNLLPQAIYGTIFCLPFGFSFTILRVSTLLLGLIGVLATYGLLKEAKIEIKRAVLGTLLIALNPIYFGLSNSFNSDVPSFALGVLSIYCIVRGLRIESNSFTAVGIALTLIAVFNRQSNLVILWAFALAFLVRKGVKPSTIAIAISPFCLGFLGQLLYSRWLGATRNLPVLYGFQIQHLRENFAEGVPSILSIYCQNAVIVLVYSGLFLFPILVLDFIDRLSAFSRTEKRGAFFTILLLAAIGSVLVIKGEQMPFIGNTLTMFGLGPEAFDGYSSVLSPIEGKIVRGIWKILTVIGFIGASFLLLCFLDASRKIIRSRKENWLLIFTVSIAVFYFGLIGGIDRWYWFDRYLIFLLPVFLTFLAPGNAHPVPKKRSPVPLALALSMLFLYGGFTVAATHDYLAWNRARWQALNDLQEIERVPPEKIYGGFEFNGWYFGNRLETCNPAYLEQSTGIDWGTFDCLWGEDTETYRYLYTLGFDERPGYRIEKRYSFARWLPPLQQELYVLKKV